VAEDVLKGIRKTVIRRKREDKPTLSGDRVIILDSILSSQLYNKGFGEIKKDRLYLSLYEACLLVDEGKLDVYDEKKLGFKKLLKVGEGLNENFGMKYDIFRDLRLSRGYIVKSGLKFGCDFVVYAHGKTPGKGHSKWMVHVMPESARVDFNEITRAARLATNVKKNMLFAIVTERGPVYYEIGRAKM
jgi:tRNA-intron endonuclease